MDTTAVGERYVARELAGDWVVLGRRTGRVTGCQGRREAVEAAATANGVARLITQESVTCCERA